MVELASTACVDRNPERLYLPAVLSGTSFQVREKPRWRGLERGFRGDCSPSRDSKFQEIREVQEATPSDY
jgi:hypothetical protein